MFDFIVDTCLSNLFYYCLFILFCCEIIFHSSKPDILIEKKVKDIKKGKEDSKENFDLSDIEKNSQDGFLLSVIGSMPEQSAFETDLCNVNFNGNVSTPIQEATVNLQAVVLDKPEISNNTVAVKDAVRTEKETEISACVVCDKKFKSKSCMNKHLRSVHAGLFKHISIELLFYNVSVLFCLFIKFTKNRFYF